jgi:hypothetical protein
MHRRVLLEVRDKTSLSVVEIPEDTLVVVRCEGGFDAEEPPTAASGAQGRRTLEAMLRGELVALDGTLSRALALSGAITVDRPGHALHASLLEALFRLADASEELRALEGRTSS